MENASVKKGMDGRTSLTSPIVFLVMSSSQAVENVI